MKQMNKKTLRQYTEYLLIKAFGIFFRHIPTSAAFFFGWSIAGLGVLICRGKIKKAEHRITEVFGNNFSGREISAIAWISWRNLIFSSVELIRMPVTDFKKLNKNIEIQNRQILDLLQQRCEQKQGAIVVVFHMGSWEMSAYISQSNKIPLFSLAAKQSNPFVTNYINELRQCTGLETIERDKSALKKISRNLKSGKVLAILPDVRSLTPGLKIKFLGKTANIPQGMGYLARQANVPLFPCVITRKGWTHHQYEFLEPIWPDYNLEKSEDNLRMTQEVFSVFSKRIEAQPEQWFWFNNRWLFDAL
jgi:Kdo2-lipid IVA lauroyltransferase/acyltransferase